MLKLLPPWHMPNMFLGLIWMTIAVSTETRPTCTAYEAAECNNLRSDCQSHYHCKMASATSNKPPLSVAHYDSVSTASPRSPFKTGQFTAHRQGAAQSPTTTSAADRFPTPSSLPRRRQMRSCQKIALIVASLAVLGLMVWSHIVTGSAVHLLHLPERLHVESKAYQDKAVATDTAGATTTDGQSSVMLFDDTAKLAIDAQRRRDEVAQAEKKQAAERHVNLEWQRHHHTEGSVYQRTTVQT